VTLERGVLPLSISTSIPEFKSETALISYKKLRAIQIKTLYSNQISLFKANSGIFSLNIE
jgi:hypothetical protein